MNGNRLTGCIPEGLRDIKLNDLDDLELPDCGVGRAMREAQEFDRTAFMMRLAAGSSMLADGVRLAPVGLGVSATAVRVNPSILGDSP